MTTSVIRHANRQNWFYGLLTILVVFAVAFPFYLVSAVAEQNTDNIRELACILISQAPDDPAKPVIHDFRVKYHCPPFNPASVGHLPTPSTVTRTVQKPGATTTAHATAHVTAVVPIPTTETVPMPGRTVTVTRTVTKQPPPCLKNLTLPPCTVLTR